MAVEVHSAADYARMRMFTTPDGKSGFALDGDNIVSLFKHPDSTDRKVGLSALALAIQLGGKRLDAFDTELPHIYSNAGFRAVARLPFSDEHAPPGWDYKKFSAYNGGRPDVVFMVHDSDYGAHYRSRDGQKVTSYDDGVAAQTDAIETPREHPGRGYTAHAYVDSKGVIHTDDVQDATRALYEDREVELSQPDEVATLISHLGDVTAKMIELGIDAPRFDLCNVSIEGTNLFCAESLGIPRIEMPQLDAQQTKEFRKHLEEKGYAVEKTKEYASHLRATQNELDGAKVAKIAGKIRNDPKEGQKRIIVSRDNYILDGHHHWGARLGINAEEGKLDAGVKMKISRIDIAIIDLLKEAEAFTGGKGKQKQFRSCGCDRRDFDPNQPRDEQGQWTDGGGGDGGGGAAPAGGAESTESHGARADRIVSSVPGAKEKVAQARERLAKAAPTHVSVDQGGFKTAGGRWTPEREQAHDKILAGIFTPQTIAAATPKGGEKPTLHLLGGSGGSGKSWFTSDKGTVSAKDALYINGDDVKAALPGYEGWNAAMFHEEASDLSKAAEQAARDMKLNVILDGTMNNAKSLDKRVADYKAAGYRIVGHYMHVSPETAATRATERFVRGGETGRFVPPEVVLGMAGARANFEKVSPELDAWEMYDNESKTPKLIAQG